MSNGVSNPKLDAVLNPLSQAQLDDLQDSLNDIAAAKAALEKMRLAGIDVTAQLADLDKSEQQARALLNVYGT